MGSSPGMSTHNHKTILLVEDNPDLRTATEDLLATLGYEVIAARNTEQALEIARREPIDLVVVNAYPNQGSGLDTVDELRSNVPYLPALLVSGFGDDLGLRQRVMAGDVGFLTLPFSLDSLKAKIEETFEQEPLSIDRSPADLRETLAPPPITGWVARSRPWLAAAAVALAAGLVFQLGDRAPEMPAPDLSEIRRSQQIEILEPVGEVDGRPKRLAWRQVPDSVLYRVVISTVDNTVIWESETGETSIDLPEHVADQLHLAVSYFWQVEGFAENFSGTGRSMLIAFRPGSPGPA